MIRHLKKGQDAAAIAAADHKVRTTVEQILAAIEQMLQPGSGAPRTPDLGGTGSTSDVGKAIAALI